MLLYAVDGGSLMGAWTLLNVSHESCIESVVGAAIGGGHLRGWAIQQPLLMPR